MAPTRGQRGQSHPIPGHQEEGGREGGRGGDMDILRRSRGTRVSPTRFSPADGTGWTSPPLSWRHNEAKQYPLVLPKLQPRGPLHPITGSIAFRTKALSFPESHPRSERPQLLRVSQSPCQPSSQQRRQRAQCPRVTTLVAARTTLNLSKLSAMAFFFFLIFTQGVRIFSQLIFRVSRREGRGGRERHPCDRDTYIGCLPHAPKLTGGEDQTCNHSMCP